eukprot:TRINITY_DN12564_c0_g1_i1.p1 TRINITY_DN12564_c0_g1~~TRINITY_DN12564_c0_g1_i1.p1  ORF type:complete len:385 (+),score=45.90 TRINITY_DN12564_c0_g1_i1:70-1224(+)
MKACAPADTLEKILVGTFDSDLESAMPLLLPKKACIFAAGFKQYQSALDLLNILQTLMKTCKSKTRKSILRFLLVWMTLNFRHDFVRGEDGKTFRIKLARFLKKAQRKHPTEVNAVKLTLIKQSRRARNRKILDVKDKGGPKKSARQHFLDIDARLLAEQLTLRDAGLFQSILQKEVYNLSWKKKKKKLSKNVIHQIERFNQVSFWVASEVVMTSDLKQRAAKISKFITIASICEESNNFNTLMAIIGGLNESSVARLKQTWAHIKGSQMETFETLNTLMSTKTNYAHYRRALDRAIHANQPVVPYLGVYLRDLTFIEEANQNMHNDLINADKLIMIGEVVLSITLAQRSAYTIEPDTPTQQFIGKLLVLPKDMLYSYSERLEK